MSEVRRLIAVELLVAGLLFAAAPTNSLTITELDSTTQNDRPTRLARPFAAGEVWGYPRPVVDGTPATSWQATVKTRHRDGRASCSVTGASNEYPITVTCADHGFRNGEYVSISGVGGNTAANGWHRIIRRGRHTFFLQGATGNGSYTSGGTATGPGPGSVRHAIIVLDDDVDLTADGSLTITFQDSPNACHLGDLATCEAAALSEAEMLAWGSSGWGAEIEATQGNTYTANARTMVDAGDFEYWIAGPILTEVIVRDHSSARAWDFGWACNSNCPFYAESIPTALDAGTDTFTYVGHGFTENALATWSNSVHSGAPTTCYMKNVTADTFQCSTTEGGAAYDFSTATSNQEYLNTDYAQSTWVTDATNKSLSPIFVLAFYDNLPNSVRIDYILENIWYGHLQDERYSLVLTSDSTGSTSEYTKAEFTHFARQRWRKVFWDGAEPGAINIDHNENYLEYTGAIPVFADDISPGAADVSYLSTCAGYTFDIGDNGCYSTDFGATGGRLEIGFLMQWASTWFQTFDSTLWPVVWGNDNVSGNIPMHVREASTDTTLYYVDVDGDGATDNDAGDAEVGNGVHGRIVSIDARPTVTNNGGGNVTILSTSDGWDIDMAHQSAFGYSSYLVTGEWYLLEEMQFWAQYDVSHYDASYAVCGRMGSWGLLTYCVQTRGIGWAGRNITRAAWMSPDGTVEKEYFTNKLENNIMSAEGVQILGWKGASYLPLIGNSDDAPCAGLNAGGANWTDRNPYCLGAYYYTENGQWQVNPMGSTTPGQPGYCDSYTTGDRCESPWMQSFLVAGFWGTAKDMGYPTDDLIRHVAPWFFQFNHDQSNPVMMTSYRVPAILGTTGEYPVSPRQTYEDGLTEAGKTRVFQEGDLYNALNYTFPYTRGALPYLTEGHLGSLNWRTIWNYWSNPANVENTDTRCLGGSFAGGCNTSALETRFNLAPRLPATKRYELQVGDTFSVWTYTAPRWDSACTVDDNDDGQSGTGRQRSYVLTGLTAETEYNHGLSCPDDPWGSETVSYTTSATISGTADLTVRVGAGDTTTYLDWGYTNSLTETPVSESCSSGCILTASGVNKGLVYYRIRHADGRAGSITQMNLE